MGWNVFGDNEEEVMDSFVKHKIISKDINEAYPYQIKSLLRKKLISKLPNGNYVVTKRGINAFNAFSKTGHYYLFPVRGK